MLVVGARKYPLHLNLTTETGVHGKLLAPHGEGRTCSRRFDELLEA